MPLDPTAAALIESSRASGRPNAHLLPVEAARANFESDLGVLARPDIPAIRDLAIPVEGTTIRARLYRPVADADRLPVVVYFHGGGWLLGSVESHDATTRRLALITGTAVLSIGYRRGPECRFPTAVDDAVASIRWTVQQADELGVDADRLAVAGDSAGGNLATAAAAVLRDDAEVRIRHQVLVYPVTTCDLDVGFDETYEGVMLFRDELMWHQQNYLAGAEQATDPRVSMLSADLRGLPPATILLAECDPIRPQGARYADALRAAGVDVALHEYAGMIHGFFGLDMIWDQSRQAMEIAAARLTSSFSAGNTYLSR